MLILSLMLTLMLMTQQAPGSLGAGETDDREVMAAIEASKREGTICNEDEDVLMAMAESM